MSKHEAPPAGRSPSGDHAAAGRAALARGAWEEARTRFAAALEDGESAEAQEGLGWALWWLDRIDESFAARERAFFLYSRADGTALERRRPRVRGRRRPLRAVGGFLRAFGSADGARREPPRRGTEGARGGRGRAGAQGPRGARARRRGARGPRHRAPARAPLSQDWMAAAPKGKKVLLDNAKVRVIELTLGPGQKEPVHTHPANFAYLLSSGKVRVAYVGGETAEMDAKAGQVLWSDPEPPHTLENLSKRTLEAVVVELKEHSYVPAAK